jgi:hypothetical protein|nr:MAG TPA: hypothetical protein [Siphoviridae sp. ctvzh6]
MLKIRDDVDLKELKKFGFERIINDTYSKRMNNSDDRYETSILVNPSNKETENHVVYYINNDEKIGNIEKDDIDLTGELDTLYDLIKADLVVKE